MTNRCNLLNTYIWKADCIPGTAVGVGANAMTKTAHSPTLVGFTFYQGAANPNRELVCQALVTGIGRPHQDSLQKDAVADW